MVRPKNSSNPQSGSSVVIYETSANRDQVLQTAPQALLPSDFDWASFRSIESGTVGEAFFQKAAAASTLVIAACPEGEFPPRVKSWLDRWALKRTTAQGVLIGFFLNRKLSDLPTTKELYLRQIAHQGGVEYRSHLTHSSSVPDSLDSYSERADHVTSLLDDILKHRPSAAPPL